MFYPVNGDPYRENVVLHVPFTGANNSTTFTDVSPTPKTLTRNGDTKISTAQSKWGQGSGYFDGTGDYLTCGYSSDIDLLPVAFCIEGWFYLLSDTTYPMRFVWIGGATGSFNGTDGIHILITIPNATPIKLSLQVAAGASLVNYTGTTTLTKNAWHHFACTSDTTTLRVYLDGVLDASGSASTVTRPTGNPTLTIGMLSSTQYFYGYLQDLRITKGVARYTADFDVPAGPLPARLPELPVRSILPHPFHQIARLGL